MSPTSPELLSPFSILLGNVAGVNNSTINFTYIQCICEALEGVLGIQGYWSKTLRDMGYFC